MVQTLPNRDVDISVDMGSSALPRRGLNIGMILTNSVAIITADARCIFFATLNELIDAGFQTTSPEYIAAQAYFNQDGNLGANVNGVYIGVWDSLNTQTPETITDALIACRNVTPDWYAFTACFELTTSQIQTVAAATQSLDPASRFIAVTDDTEVRDGTEGNVYEELKLASYYRTLPVWHEDVNVFGAALLGYISGAMSDLAGSAYTLKFKQIIGELPSNLTSGQANLIEGNNGNVYVQRAKPQFEQGTNSDGSWFDEWLYIDKLVNDIQMGVYDVLYNAPKEPQTEGGQNDISSAIAQACDKQVLTGFLAPGKWRRKGILKLNRDDFVPAGYLIQWSPVDEQADADRAARKAQPFYVALVLAGAIHSVLVQLNVSR